VPRHEAFDNGCRIARVIFGFSMLSAPGSGKRVPLSLHIGLAALMVGAAVVLTRALQSSVSITGYIFFYAAVVAASWFGGRWPGVLAVVLSTLAVEYYFMPPVHSFAVRPDSVPVFIEFAASSVVISWFSSWRKEAETALTRARNELQMRVEERTAELRQTNEQLLAEIAERQRAEEAYRDAQAELARVSRMSALGTLAASLSHAVNQPLAAVVTNADACSLWLANDPPNLEEVRAAVDSIAREGTRASDVVRRIRAMFTKAAPERASVQLNDLIHEVASLLQPEISKNSVELAMQLDANLPETMADRVQLQQVLVNLLQNGIEAMSAVTDRPRRLTVRTESTPPGEILVAVRDSGVGIEAKDQRRIFDAFFTTKAQGMGMGLSISQTIIEAHGGRLWAASNGDHGTTLQFTLPERKPAQS
jgi:C4-dicarboxylate-specific signal transduction histidine kinase